MCSRVSGLLAVATVAFLLGVYYSEVSASRLGLVQRAQRTRPAKFELSNAQAAARGGFGMSVAQTGPCVLCCRLQITGPHPQRDSADALAALASVPSIARINMERLQASRNPSIRATQPATRRSKVPPPP